MPNIKKIKGQSAIVSTIFLITIAVLIVAVAYAPIKKMIETPLLSPESCLEKGLEQSISIGPSCYNPLTNNLEVIVTKTTEESIESTLFKLNFENETLSWQCCPNCAGCKALAQGTKTYHLFPDRIPKTVTVIVNGCSLSTKEVTSC